LTSSTLADGRGVQIIPVLLYHSVSDHPSPAIAQFAVTPRAFERHLELILEEGAEALTVSGLIDRRMRGEPLPPRPVLITFDDGFADTLDVAAPRLWSRGLAATLYLTTGYLAGRTRRSAPEHIGAMIPWERLCELEAAGFELGAHTHSHPQLDVLPLREAAAEVRTSRILLETALGHPVRSFAYPHGYASPWLRAEVQRAGFESACGVREALSHAADDRWCMARLSIRATTPVETVGAWLRGEGAPVAGPERLRTRAWRAVRRMQHLTSVHSGRRRAWEPWPWHPA
jgi:peptidoglycan/xylan/chitin deacetylase (PgdA/CDA1 family)